MVFSSNVFLLCFMPVFFLVYFLMPKKTRNYTLLLASLVFYAWGAPDFLVQLLLSIIANFYLVKAMCRTDKPRRKKLLCTLSLLVSLGLLAYYKYAGFFLENLSLLTPHLSPLTSHLSTIVLPIGISFFSFQSVTYTLDTYRGVNRPMDRLSDYMLYITMFPQLIAGPIVRYNEVADQIRQRESTLDDRLRGFYRFVIGLSKKILIADVLGAQVDAVLKNPVAGLDTGTAWIVALAYTFQIYFDFAGYSDMAIGLGRIMGFRFPENFDNPYTSRSVTEFWKRWHITLGNFIMNYLYIPLGGNRKGKARTYLNLWICFLLSGLWHGASWNFVLWGAFHGLFICLDKLFKEKGERLKVKGASHLSPFTSHLSTFLIVSILWMFFRIEDVGDAFTFVGRMFAFDFAPVTLQNEARFYFTLCLAFVFSFITLFPFGKKLQEKVYFAHYTDRQHVVVWIISIFAFLFCIAALNASRFSPFIYFRF